MRYKKVGVDFEKECTIDLCDLNKKPIMNIHNIESFVRKVSFVGVDELSFNVPYYRPSRKGRVKNELYDLIQGDKYIVLNYGKYDEQYFIIQNPEESQSKNGEVSKSVTAYSGEYYFANKMVRFYDRPSRKVYSNENEKDKDGFHVGFLNRVMELTTWTVDYISPKVQQKYRELKFSNRSILDCLKTCSEVFDCIFFFDTKEETISCYDVKELGGNAGIVISDRNFIESLKKSINTEEIKTRLYLLGADDVGFQMVNPTGQEYIDNIDYYVQAGYVTDRLKKELQTYDEKMKQFEPQFKEYLSRVHTDQDNVSRKMESLRELHGERRKQRELLDGAIQSRGAIKTEPVLKTLAHIENQIEAKDKELTGLKETLEKDYKDLKKLQENIGLETVLSKESLVEYDRLIKDEVQSDSSFGEGMEEDLMAYAKEKLLKLSYPSISFSVDVEDFRKIARFKNPMERLKVGDMVYLESEEMNFNVEVRLLAMTLEYDNQRIMLEFGNKYTADDPNLYLSELIGNIKSISTTVSNKNTQWDKGIEAYSTIAKYLNHDLDLAKQAIVNAKNQVPLLDDRGLWLLKKNEDGTIDNSQVRGINNVIAFTNNNWKTVGTAISGDGINAEAIRGRLGEFVTINANQIIVSKTGLDSESDLAKWAESNITSKLENVMQNIASVLEGKVDKDNGGILDVPNKPVFVNKLYNRVKITPEHGIQVFDSNSRERVKIGEITNGVYGIKVLDSTGHRTMLDDRGMLQSWQDGRCDNADGSHPLYLRVYIPQECREIYRARVVISLERFRSYSTGMSGGGGINTSTESGGGVSDYFTSYSGGGRTTTSHGASQVSFTENNFPVYNSNGSRANYFTTVRQVHYHEHDVDFPDHNHETRVSFPSHSHSVYSEPHVHSIVYGIYENTKSSTRVSISVNGENVLYNSYVYDKQEQDITSYLKRGQWNDITISPNDLIRVDATVFVQALMNI